MILGLLSIWFSDPTRLATAFGLVSAGLAFALQQVVTSLAGYFVILRGNTFTVGDRISMGGVRGDVMRLGFIQTTIMEMGQPPSVQGADPAMWVKSRQFTGRIVTVSNSKIFANYMEMGQPPSVQGADPAMWVKSRQFTGRIVTVSNSKIFAEPVFNYSRDFPFIWEEIVIPITYQADRDKAESVMIAAAKRHAADPDAMPADAKENLQSTFGVEPVELDPKVFYRITDNWLELTVRFIVGTHRIRGVKDAMARHIISAFDEAGIGIASATYDIVGFPPIEVKRGRESKPTA